MNIQTTMQPYVEKWYGDVIRSVLERRNQLPHALLISGPSGIGKLLFADLLVHALLCQNAPQGRLFCGQCQACKLKHAGTHPDYYLLEREGKGTDKQAKEIKIDQVRQLCQSLIQTSQLGGLKIAVIEPADAMNRNAANSLLKTLEEPAADTLLILVSASASAMLPTIRSRCQQLQLSLPAKPDVIACLTEVFPEHPVDSLYAAADGAPFTAAELAGSDALQRRLDLFHAFRDIARQGQDPVSRAAKSARTLDRQTMCWILSWVQDLICLRSSGDINAMQNVDLQKDLQAIASRIHLPELYRFYDKAQQAMTLLRSSVNLQLLLESLLFDWSAATTTLNEQR